MLRVLVRGLVALMLAEGMASTALAQPRPARRPVTPARRPSVVVAAPTAAATPAPTVDELQSRPPPTPVTPAPSAPTPSTPPTDRRGYLSLALVGGYGAASDLRSANYLGGMVGGRATYTFGAPTGFVFGVEGLRGFGSSEMRSSDPTSHYSATMASVYVGALMGVDAAAGPVVFRAYAAAGASVAAHECQSCYRGQCNPCSSDGETFTRGAVGLGLALNFMTRYVFFGADVRAMYFVGAGYNSVALMAHGVLGVRFR